MTNSVFIEGIELVRIRRLTNDGFSSKPNSQEDRHFRRAERDLKEMGINRVFYDENDLMTCEQGAVYALHGSRYVTQSRIDEIYTEMGKR